MKKKSNKSKQPKIKIVPEKLSDIERDIMFAGAIECNKEERQELRKALDEGWTFEFPPSIIEQLKNMDMTPEQLIEMLKNEI